MSHDTTPTGLTQLDALDPGVPPIDTLLTSGRAVRRRRRRAAIVGTVAATALVVGGGAVAAQMVDTGTGTDTDTGQETTVAQAVEAPEGTRLVGLGRVVVAVPEDWAANPTLCNRIDSRRPRIIFYSPASGDCADPTRRDESSIAVSSMEPPDGPASTVSPSAAGPVEGYSTLNSGQTCIPDREQCLASFGIRDLNAWFTVRVPESDTDTIDQIRDSLTVLPDGYTTVPGVPGATEEREVTAALREAGLAVEVQHTTCPPNAGCLGGVSDINPAVGTVLPAGSTITVTALSDDRGRSTLGCPPFEQTASWPDYPGPGQSTPGQAVAMLFDGPTRTVHQTKKSATVLALAPDETVTRIYQLSRSPDGWWVDAYTACSR